MQFPSKISFTKMQTPSKISVSSKSSASSRRRQVQRSPASSSAQSSSAMDLETPLIPSPNPLVNEEADEYPDQAGREILEDSGNYLHDMIQDEFQRNPQGSIAATFTAARVQINFPTAPLPTSNVHISEITEGSPTPVPVVTLPSEKTPAATVPAPETHPDAPIVESGSESGDNNADERAESEESTFEEQSELPERETDTARGETSVAMEPHNTFAPIHGYPDPRTIFTDVAQAMHLLESGGMTAIAELDYKKIRELGPDIRSSSLTFCPLDVYDQILISYAAKYYSTLPFASPSMNVLRVLHLFSVIAAGGEAVPVGEYDEARRIVGMIKAERLDAVVSIVARMVMPHEVRVRSDGLVGVSLTDYITLFAEIRMNYVEALIGYNFVHQLVVGGLECVVPIPDVCRSNEYLRMYLTKISGGRQKLRMGDILVTPRPFVMKVVATEAPLLIQPQALDVPQNVPQQKDKDVATPVVSKGVMPLKKRKPQESQLMPQGKPTGHTVIRNTDSFRASVVSDDDLRKLCLTLSESHEKIIKQQETIMETLGVMAPKLAAIEASLATLAVRGARQDLSSRADYSRSVLQTQTTEAMQITQASPSIQPVAPRERDVLIARLEKAPNATADARLATDLTNFFKGVGEAKTVKPATLSTQIARKRLISRLSTMA